jgi:hypothetical protein
MPDGPGQVLDGLGTDAGVTALMHSVHALVALRGNAAASKEQSGQ